MAYYEDMESCNYHEGPHSASSWHCPLLAIGWLDGQHPYSTGEVPNNVLAKLKQLASEFQAAFPLYHFRGLHHCSIGDCDSSAEWGTRPLRYIPWSRDCSMGDDAEERNPPLKDSHVNLFIPGTHAVFIAPGRIDHYIEHHSYKPPDEFLIAVENCASPLSPAYRECLRKLNHGSDAPLYEGLFQ